MTHSWQFDHGKSVVDHSASVTGEKGSMPRNWIRLARRLSRGIAASFLLALVTLAPSTSYSAEATVDVQGQWLANAAGVETSGLAVDSDNQFWTVADGGTAPLSRIIKKGKRFELGRSYAIAKGEKVLSYDFEDLCVLSNSNFLVVAERTPNEGPPALLEIDREGKLIRQWPIILADLKADASKKPDANKGLEGIACSGKEVFFANEKPPQILMLKVPDGGLGKATSLKPELLYDASHDISDLSGIYFVKQEDKDYLLALAPEQHLLLRFTLGRNAEGKRSISGVQRTQLRLMAPGSDREVCRAKPEGITVANGKIWIINDPPNDPPNDYAYRTLRAGELRQGCAAHKVRRDVNFERHIPILFHLVLDDILQPKSGPAPTPPPTPTSPPTPTARRHQRHRRK